MAITVDDNKTQRDSYDAAVSGTTNIGSGAGPGLAGDSIYQGTDAWGRKQTAGGFWTAITTIDMTASANLVVMSKSLTLNSAKILAAGQTIRIGSSTSAYYEYIVADEGTRPGFTYPPKGGWIIMPINPNVSAWIDAVGTTPTLTTVTDYAVTTNVSTGAKDLNIFIDACDFSEGLFLVGNTPDGTWQDFLDHDEGSITTGRIGHCTEIGGVLYVFGKFVIGSNSSGTASATSFTDASKTVIFPGGMVAAGWNLLEADLTNASTDIAMTSMVYSGLGRDDLKTYFDSELEATGGATDTIDITAHGYEIGDAVLYSAEGGTVIGGLTTATEYFVGDVTANAFDLFTTRPLAVAGGGGIALTPATAGNGQNHSLRRQPSTLPYLTATSTSGTFAATACTFSRFGITTLTNAVTLVGCTFAKSKQMVLGDATLTSCVMDSPFLPPGEAFLQAIHAIDLDLIDGTSFTSAGTGHAIEVTTDSTVANNTAALQDVLFTGYGPALKGFNASTDVDDANDEIDITTHGFSDGDPVYYVASDKDTGAVGTKLSGLTSENLYYVEAVTADTLSLHLSEASALLGASGNTVAITAGSSENHQICSANAALFNDTGGDLTINVTDGDSPSVRNSSGSTTDVVSTVNVTLQGVTEGATLTMVALTGGDLAVGTAIGTFPLTANSSGVGQVSHSYTNPQPVSARARYSGAPLAAIEEENAVGFVDYTTEANNTVDSVPLMPATQSANDAFYVGMLTEFDKLKFTISTAKGGTWSLTWQYWNGAWTALSGVVDGTSDFSSTGVTEVTFTRPGDWTSENRSSSGSPTTTSLYFVRALLTGFSSSGTRPLATKVSGNPTRYLPFSIDASIESTGLTVQAVWIEDSIVS